MSNKMRKFGLIGYPLSHSFSPAFFTEKFAREGYADCTYEAFPIPSINDLTALLQNNPQLEGLNVTIPYKKQVINFLNESDNAVKQMNACNCIKITNGRLSGYNTDVTGFEQSLIPHLSTTHNHALILGTGGSAEAVKFVLNKLGIAFLSVSRGAKAGAIVYEQITKEIIEKHKLIINTTPVGMVPGINACPAIPYQFITQGHYLFDLIYNPAETIFLKKGAEKGAITKNGADMLVIQALESWRIWNEQV